MGVFDFLKKSKAETAEPGMELPPIPRIEEPGEMAEEEEKAFPLPPLPSEVPGELPPTPEMEELETPKIEVPKAQKIERAKPEKIWVEEAEKEMPAPRPEFPTISGKAEEFVPEKIPPLEGIPEAPEFKPEEAEEIERPEPEMPSIEAETPSVYAEPEEQAKPKKRGPLYIRSDRFKAVIDDIDQIRTKFKEEDDIFFRISDIKNSQDQLFEDFRQSLEDIQRKLLFIDRSLFEAK